MSTEYVPTTAQMREWFSEPRSEFEALSPDAHYEAKEMFDRWFSEEIKSAHEVAWDEGCNAGEENAGNGFAALLTGVESIPMKTNPYRKDKEAKE